MRRSLSQTSRSWTSCPRSVLDPIYEATIYGEEGMDIAEEVRIPTVRGLDFMFASDHLGPILRDIFGVRDYEPVRDPETTWWARVLSNMHTGEQGLFTHVPRFARQLEEVSTVPFAESELFPEAAEAAQFYQSGVRHTLRDVLGSNRRSALGLTWTLGWTTSSRRFRLAVTSLRPTPFLLVDGRLAQAFSVEPLVRARAQLSPREARRAPRRPQRLAPFPSSMPLGTSCPTVMR